MQNLENFKNGSSVKVLVSYQRYVNHEVATVEELIRGILYKGNSNSNQGKILLISDKPAKSYDYGVYPSGYYAIVNVLTLNISHIKEIAPTRFKKEISDILNRQYKSIVEQERIVSEISKLEHRQGLLQKQGNEDSILLINLLSKSNFKDVGAWKERIKRDISDSNYRVYDNKVSLSYYIKNIQTRGSIAEITFNFNISREERLLSKEYEDRIRRDESITKTDIIKYRPREEKLLQSFKGKAIFSESKVDYTIQDKGWVTFYLTLDGKFKVDLKEYDKWLKQFKNHMGKNFPVLDESI